MAPTGPGTPLPYARLSITSCGCWVPCGWIWPETFCFQWVNRCGQASAPGLLLRWAGQAGGEVLVCRSPCPACCRPGGWESKQLPHVLRGACPDCRQHSKPSRYFLRASRPINNSSGCGRARLMPPPAWPPARQACSPADPRPHSRASGGVSRTPQTPGPQRVECRAEGGPRPRGRRPCPGSLLGHKSGASVAYLYDGMNVSTQYRTVYED